MVELHGELDQFSPLHGQAQSSVPWITIKTPDGDPDSGLATQCLVPSTVASACKAARGVLF